MRYTSIRLPRKMIEAVERVILSNPGLNYASVQDFVVDALDRHLRRVQSLLARGRKVDGEGE